jgi:hypothetical protein
MSEGNFRKDLIAFLVQASQKDENYYGYINPHLLCDTISALYNTTGNQEPELDSLMDWADEYWGW